MSIPTLSQVNQALGNVDFIKAELEDFLSCYDISGAYICTEARATAAQTRTIQAASQMVFSMAVTLAVYPISETASLTVGDICD